jgi:hypothetical protein
MGYYAMLDFALNAFDVQPEQLLLPVSAIAHATSTSKVL